MRGIVAKSPDITTIVSNELITDIVQSAIDNVLTKQTEDPESWYDTLNARLAWSIGDDESKGDKAGIDATLIAQGYLSKF